MTTTPTGIAVQNIPTLSSESPALGSPSPRSATCSRETDRRPHRETHGLRDRAKRRRRAAPFSELSGGTGSNLFAREIGQGPMPFSCPEKDRVQSNSCHGSIVDTNAMIDAPNR